MGSHQVPLKLSSPITCRTYRRNATQIVTQFIGIQVMGTSAWEIHIELQLVLSKNQHVFATCILLAPFNFPMVVVGSHRGNHFNQPLYRILVDTVREGSLLSQKHSHIHMALNKHAQGYISAGNIVVCRLKIER